MTNFNPNPTDHVGEFAELIVGLLDTARFLLSKNHTNGIYCHRAAEVLTALQARVEELEAALTEASEAMQVMKAPFAKGDTLGGLAVAHMVDDATERYRGLLAKTGGE